MDSLERDRALRRAGYERLREDLLEIESKIHKIAETVVSPDGLVSATVVGRGRLSALDLDSRIYRTTDSKALAAVIVNTIQEAADRAYREVYAVTHEHLLPDEPIEYIDTSVH